MTQALKLQPTAGADTGHPSPIVALGAGLLVAGTSLAATEIALKPVWVVAEVAPGVPFRAPRGVAIDTLHHEILLANSGDHRIEVYTLGGDAKARFIHRVQSPAGAWTDGVPQTLAVDRAGRIFVSDALARYVDVLDYRGRSIARLALPEPTAGPGALAILPDGGVLVAERGKAGRVHRFDAALAYQGAWGVSGTDEGQLSGIIGLGMLPGGEVAVACQPTQLAVQIFSSTGQYLRGFGVHEVGPGNFSLPSGLAVTAGGRIWVSDELRHTLQVFEPSGSFLAISGGPGPGPGQYFYPSALASDGASLVAVAEREGGRFQLLRVQ